MDDAQRLERLLYEQIPLSAAMGVRVQLASPEAVCLRAPLLPNINHLHTVFGGSAVAVATLSAWSLLHLKLAHEQLPAHILIQRSTMHYEQPLAGDFEAHCSLPGEALWTPFHKLLRRRGRARLSLSAQLLAGGTRKALFEGDFVAFLGPSPP